MAVQSICSKLFNDLDGSCASPSRKYYQQAVIINKSSLDTFTITKQDFDTQTCNYKVTFTLKAGETGYRISGPEAGSSFYGSYDKSRSDIGHPQYIHNVGILISGVNETSKCILDSLDKGSFFIALQSKDGTVEIFGLENSLTTGDYSYNIQEGGGGNQIILSSLEESPENSLPLVYESDVPGQETIDFDDAFAQAS